MIYSEPPNLGHTPNWDMISKRIQCWADAVGAMVYHVGHRAVFALDQEEAAHIAATEGYKKELEHVRKEIRSLEWKISDLEDKIEGYEEEERKLLKAMQEARQLAAQKEPEWIKDHPTFAFGLEVRK